MVEAGAMDLGSTFKLGNQMMQAPSRILGFGWLFGLWVFSIDKAFKPYSPEINWWHI
jgi:hypothetical protein